MLLDALEDELKNDNITWKHLKFVDANKRMVPDEPGVYFFCVSPSCAKIHQHHIILYFGKAKTSLRNRFGEYMTERRGLRPQDRDKIVKMLNVYKNRISFGYCVLDMYSVERVEDILLKAFCPPCNTTLPKFEPAF